MNHRYSEGITEFLATLRQTRTGQLPTSIHIEKAGSCDRKNHTLTVTLKYNAPQPIIAHIRDEFRELFKQDRGSIYITDERDFYFLLSDGSRIYLRGSHPENFKQIEVSGVA